MFSEHLVDHHLLTCMNNEMSLAWYIMSRTCDKMIKTFRNRARHLTAVCYRLDGLSNLLPLFMNRGTVANLTIIKLTFKPYSGFTIFGVQE